jgi:GNAT superfamily N-acetyltransferase
MLSLVQARDLDPEALARFLATPAAPAGFRRSETAAYYRWLVTASGDVETVALAALAGDRIVGFLCAVLRRLTLEGETLLAGKLEEMRTDPAERGRGVMSLVFSGVRDACLARGAHVLFAGPTSPFSYPIFTGRYGFVEPFALASFVRPLRVGRLPLAFVRADAQASSGLPADAAALAAHLSAGARVALQRSQAYLQWRYERHPDAYRFVVLREDGAARGLAVWKETRQRGLRIANLLECLAPTPRERARLLDAVAGVAVRDASCQILTGWATLGLGPASLLRHACVLRRAHTPLLLWHDGSLSPASVARLRDRDAWLLSMGDFFDV